MTAMSPRMPKLLVAYIAASMLAACAHAPRPTAEATKARPLAAPEAAGEHAVSQVVRGAFGAREMTLSCVVTVKDGVMSVVGLNALGVRLFTIRYDGRLVSADKGIGVPEGLTPERLLADLQLVFWPLQPLQQTLQAAGYELKESVPATRRLRRGERLVAEVHYAQGAAADLAHAAWSGRAWLVSLEYGYSLHIESQAQ
jgi:hypothetical protein